MMKLAAAILAATAFVPMSAYAGMYGDPVINIDAKDFKKAMAKEHAAVGLAIHTCVLG
jgi:protein disulfide-isomerase A6